MDFWEWYWTGLVIWAWMCCGLLVMAIAQKEDSLDVRLSIACICFAPLTLLMGVAFDLYKKQPGPQLAVAELWHKTVWPNTQKEVFWSLCAPITIVVISIMLSYTITIPRLVLIVIVNANLLWLIIPLSRLPGLPSGATQTIIANSSSIPGNQNWIAPVTFFPQPSPAPIPTFFPLLPVSNTKLGWVVGVKHWNTTLSGLLSPITETLWRPFEPLEANCHNDQSIPKHHFWECSNFPCCGIYAFKKLQVNVLTPPITGIIALWGHVIEHEEGYRGQYAYPLALLDTAPMVKYLAQMYGVPCINKEELCRLLESHLPTPSIGP